MQELRRNGKSMTYKLEPGLRRIVSPVVIILPDGSRKKYDNGAQVCEDVFVRYYRVDEIRAVNGDGIGLIEIKLKTLEAPVGSNWIGEEQTLF